ncbi:MAG: cell wall hydrolase [Pseudomonadota bacterium]
MCLGKYSLAAGLIAAAATGAFAQSVASTSNDPSASIRAAVMELAVRERSGVEAVSSTRLAQLSKPRSRGASVPGIAELTRASLADMPPAKGDAQWACLTEALYFEARGETVQGQIAVAEVILNRADSTRFPDTVCDVINQGTGRKYACQFTYTCDGRPEHMNNAAARERVGKVARIMLDGAPRLLSGGATFYHTTAVNPRWARSFRRTAKHGVHLFYAGS